MLSQSQVATARSFVRSLNVLLKSARLYGLAHSRTASQIRTAWDELQSLLRACEGQVTFAVSGAQLLLDGSPLEGGTAERSFAEMLSVGGLTSIQFSPRVTSEDFQRFLYGFAAAGGKAASLADHLKKALAESGEGTIRVNEVRFVVDDPTRKEGGAATTLVADSLGPQLANVQQIVSSPQSLLQFIAAAQGATLAGGATPLAATAGTAMPAPPATGPAASVGEADVLNLFRLVTSLAHASKTSEPQPVPAVEQMAALPANAQEMFRQGLASLAVQTPVQRPDAPMLLQLAEHLAIRFALERFERGEVKVNAVRDMLERASREMATLRKVLAVHEDRMTKAGLEVESHTDVMDRQFWSTVPESGKQEVLLSAEAWCIPPRNVRQFVEQLLTAGNTATAGSILLNYTSCIGNEDAQVRRKVASGLVDLAGLYARCEGPLLSSAVRCVAEQMRWEPDDEVRELLSATYTKLSQEAAGRRDYATLHVALRCLEESGERGRALIPKIGFVDRLPEFLEDAVRAESISADLVALLSRAPDAAADQIATRFGACARRDECQRLFAMFEATGERGISRLTDTLRSGPDGQAAATVGLLSRFAPAAAMEVLPLRLSHWNRQLHDSAVRQLATAAAPDRGRLLARIFTQLDKRVLAEAVDEMGMSQDAHTVTLLLRLARGEAMQAADALVRVKAIEALGRLRAQAAADFLRSLLDARRLLGWEHPGELRIVAAQAMAKIDPEWTRSFMTRSGLSPDQLNLAPLDPSPDTPWARQRRYSRIALLRAVDAVAETSRGECRLSTALLSLGGGMAHAQFPLPAGTQVAVKLRTGMRRVEAQALVRDTIREQVGFEIVEMGLEERSKLRRLIAGLQINSPAPRSPSH